MKINNLTFFRAWNEEDEEWVYFDLSDLCDAVSFGDTSALPIGEAPLIYYCQFIGREDKDGIKIFVGYVVDCYHWVDEDAEKEDPSWITRVVIKDIRDLPRDLFHGSHRGENKVVGNIYENPELANNDL